MKRLLFSLAALAVALLAADGVQAGHRGGCAAPCEAGCGPACGVQYVTQYQQVQRTVYRCVPVTTEREITETVMVPSWREETRQQTVMVPVTRQETRQRTVCRTEWRHLAKRLWKENPELTIASVVAIITKKTRASCVARTISRAIADLKPGKKADKR